MNLRVHIDILVIGIVHCEIAQPFRYWIICIQKIDIKSEVNKIGGMLIRVLS